MRRSAWAIWKLVRLGRNGELGTVQPQADRTELHDLADAQPGVPRNWPLSGTPGPSART